MAIHLSSRRVALACGLAGAAYLVGWGRGSRWTNQVMSDTSRRAPQGAPHWA
ncbi:MAG TPA: hypothetical protein VFF79_12285 [Conexibacter sp.]|jgi:hypothetical protein|nr:hypothetical protein [Conexibacter sp.]